MRPLHLFLCAFIGALLGYLFVNQFSSPAFKSKSSSATPSFPPQPLRINITRLPIPSESLSSLLASSTSSHTNKNWLARSLNNRETPLLIRGNLPQLNGWSPRTDKWSSEYFIDAARRRRMTSEFLVKRSFSPVVKFANLRADRPYVGGGDSNDAAASHSSRWPQLPHFSIPYTSHNLSISEFFTELSSDPSVTHSYPYFADGLSVLGQVGQDLLPIDLLCPFTDLDECDMSIWIGRANITAYTHYDSSKNMYVQLKGRKKFVLASQEGTRCGLGLFPSLHPLYRQAQFDALLSEDEEEVDRTLLKLQQKLISHGRKKTCQLTLYSGILEEGDVLYIPAYWYHRVTSLSTPSFSINSWWVDPVIASRLSGIMHKPLPFETSWNAKQKAYGTYWYLQMLLKGVEAMIRKPGGKVLWPEPFLVEELLATRFHSLFKREEKLNSTTCQQRASTVRDDTLEMNPTTCTEIDAGSLLSMLPSEMQDHFHDHSKQTSSPRISDLLTGLRMKYNPYVYKIINDYKDLDLELVRMHVMNYVEEVVWFILDGQVDLLYPFLACCLTITPADENLFW